MALPLFPIFVVCFTVHTSDQLESCSYADKQQSFFWAMGSLGGPLYLRVCYEGCLNALLLNCIFFLFFVLIFAHFQYVLIDIWISQRVSRQDASPPFFFPSSLWAWIYKLKNQAKMTLIRSPSFCRKCSYSAGTGFTATICCVFH